MRKRIAAGLTITFLATSPAPGQTQQTPAFRTEVNVLAIDVSVVGADGEPVTNLRAPEFTVKVDGTPRAVVSAEFVSFADAETRGTPDPTEAAFYTTNLHTRPGRLIVFVIDQMHMRFGSMQPLQAAISHLLDMLHPDDRVALVTIPEAGPQIDFTGDFERIAEGVKHVTGQMMSAHGRPNISISDALALVRRGGATELASAQIMLRSCGEYPVGSALQEVCQRDVLSEAERVLREVQYRTATTLRSLRGTIDALREIEGPKTLIFISEGIVIEENRGDATDLDAAAAAARVSINVLLLESSGVDASTSAITNLEDRQWLTRGLEAVAGASGGTLFRVAGGGEGVFNRIERELSGYYLLGVEATAADRDGKAHRIDVEVKRPGMVVRSRRQFVGTNAVADGSEPSEQALAAAIRSPVLATDVPLRVTSYAYQDGSSDSVRLLITAEIGDSRSEAGPYSVALVVFDRLGNPLASYAETLPVQEVPHVNGRPVTYTRAVVADPGTYTVKIAAVDNRGRRGSVEHVAHAWRMVGQEFAMSDLMLADGVPDAEALEPHVILQVNSGQLVGFVEVYAKDPAILDHARVTFEIAEDRWGAALTSGAASLQQRSSGSGRTAQALLPVTLLPPGSYVARATVSREGSVLGTLARPFVVSKTSTAAAPSVASLNLGTFEPGVLLDPEVLGYVLDRVARRSPVAGALAATISKVRAGTFAGAAREAFELGDQHTAAFLRGLELYALQRLNEAATQFRGGVRSGSRDSVPSTIFLGACFAAAGRDREAMQFWARVVQERDLPAAVYAAIGDAWLRLGEPKSAVDVLMRAEAAGAGDKVLLRLGMLFVMLNRPGEAIENLEGYLTRHPHDPEALFATMQALYFAHRMGKSVGSSSEDRERAERYASAYRKAEGPRQSLIDKWMEFVSQRTR